MKVILLAFTQLNPELDFNKLFNPRADQFKGTDAERLTEIAGRICYDSFGKGRASDAYHDHIFEVGHGSVLAHANVSLLISGVSRSLTLELIRHHVGTAVSQRSTRYVDEDQSEVIWHPSFIKAMGDVKQEEEAEFEAIVDLVTNAESQNRKLYRSIISFVEKRLSRKGVDKATARKQARGAARQFLENGLETELVFTMNLRAMLNIIAQRGVEAADEEIQELAKEFLRIGMKVAPSYFKHVKLDERGKVLNPRGLKI